MNYTETHELERLNWYTQVSVNLNYYDIRRGAWKIDWDSIEKTLPFQKTLAVPKLQSARTSPLMDAKDVLLIQRLQLMHSSSI